MLKKAAVLRHDHGGGRALHLRHIARHQGRQEAGFGGLALHKHITAGLAIERRGRPFQQVVQGFEGVVRHRLGPKGVHGVRLAKELIQGGVGQNGFAAHGVWVSVKTKGHTG